MPTPEVYPPPVLVAPAPNVNCYQREGCNFRWAWDRELQSNEYFQVQMIAPDGERRGIHPPTKDFSHWSNRDLYTLFSDWCDGKLYCHSHWTVAVVEWDGRDPSRVGRIVVEAPLREIVF